MPKTIYITSQALQLGWVQQKIETLEHAGVIKKSISPWASPIIVVPKKSAPGEAPRQRIKSMNYSQKHNG